MKILKARILGFQSFGDSGDIEFLDGFNLIIGQNNGGKSALLRGLQPSLSDDRHRTPARWALYELPVPEVRLALETNGAELERAILRSGQQHRIPVLDASGQAQTLVEKILSCKSIVFDVINSPNQPMRNAVGYPSHQLFQKEPTVEPVCAVVFPSNGCVKSQGIAYQADDTLPNLIGYTWHTDMFYFTAERMTIGESAHQHAERLTPNAQNLPAVLLTLAGSRGDLFAKLITHLRAIFPTVGNLSVTPTPQNQVEVRVWPTPSMERVELSFPLNSSGTGVSQVIAILTAIMTSEKSVIIIDEINSFLHPSAVKALLRILQTEYDEHQYIISTHAPEVISFSNPKTVHLVKRSGYESEISRIDLAVIENVKSVAEHLGVSMSDVFAADRIIWVEGPTEEMTFPFLYQQMSGGPLPSGTVFTAVANTGDFNRKRDREIVYEVYRRLSSAAANLAVNVVFSFDTEELSDPERSQMERDSGGSLKFLPRRHIECYLLDPAAIASMIVNKDPESAAIASAEAVQQALIAFASDRRFLQPEWNGDLANVDWLAKVDAARMISEVVQSMSEQRARFNKKEDSLALLRDILSQNPAQLRPLYDYVRSLVEAVAA